MQDDDDNWEVLSSPEAFPSVLEAVKKANLEVVHSALGMVPQNYIKLEGASIVGHRTIFIGGIRDPILIGQIDADGVAQRVTEKTHHTHRIRSSERRAARRGS